ncbi:MAG: gamma carbonic anhydrase family protein [Chlorobi bacterium]|nr:gamma carbonic anhydrase family protein [Chlorobiota bacterium]
MKTETGQNASLIRFKGLEPKIHPSVFLCEGVKIIGNVEIGENSSVWYNSVIRGDVDYIKIGKCTNIQDMCMIHVTNSTYPTNIGDYVSLAHSVSLHGCTIKDNVLVGIGATILDNAVIGSNSMIAAGCLVKEGFVVPEGVLLAGVPGKIIRELSDKECEKVRSHALNYMKYVAEFREGLEK